MTPCITSNAVVERFGVLNIYNEVTVCELCLAVTLVSLLVDA
ncbi:hypothetical protein JCM19233_8 [Vibrio astriarenae]|nr:hypothetical protein JCM19233_8 [Vibrio sp. C7]